MLSQQDSNREYISGEYKVPEGAVSLRPIRFMPDNEIQYYTGVTWDRNPRGVCQMYYNRCRIFGGVAAERADEVGLCDVLNEEGDVIDTIPLNAKGLRYLIKQFKCRIEN
ncbi:hypothetical protein MnBA_39770 [Marinobacterium sp. BA1]